jgi:hypothetical protein
MDVAKDDGGPVVVTFTREEALVFFEWLARFNEAPPPPFE